ncbi:hypothetical protein CTAYLR_002938 [Chrysophaeum taylorii]|uniref:Uncharacterized protein n=1 Tax=Chrysophaeum taylorii TaxID=2483200 RepID=A0AAD7UM04_9STRA|nr:hypothetical protein CTAYLR_002938 [Chrysophaeum taylorii]
MLLVVVAWLADARRGAAFAPPQGVVRAPSSRQPTGLLGAVVGEELEERRKQNIARLTWRFSRPHTLIGSIVAVPALHALAAPNAAAMCTPQFATSIFWSLVPAVLVNVFITGLNQLCDVEIDRINKPHLPVAAGDLSPARGAFICGACLVAAAATTAASPVFTPALAAVVGGSALVGAAYSAPPLRLKRWPLLAALSIVVIRGAMINACFFQHAAATAFDGTTFAPRSPRDAHLGLVVGFFGIFGVAIALMKDVPDTAGDARFKITTLSTRVGRPAVFKFAANLVVGLLAAASVAFGTAAIRAQTSPLATSRLVAALALAVLAKQAAVGAATVDAEAKAPVAAFYMDIWRMFYIAYCLLPFVR